MVPVRALSCPLLLFLLLGLWVAKIPINVKPTNTTSAQWFEIQHVQPSPQACNSAMGKINKDKKNCKNLNTFLHESFSSVATTCQTPSIACKNGRKNCHKSQEPMSLTQCEYTSGRYPDCKYKGKQLDAFFIVACEPPQEGDKKYSLVPVHLDDVV
ncbi:ribonuclease 8-like [Carlito syrichta]|nr:ribonuclease 8-like [Carlito syrichta]